MTLHPPCLRPWILTGLALLTVACGADAGAPAVTRETGPDGRAILTYAGRGDAVEDTLIPDLRIGQIEGAGPATFADIRGLEVGEDGTIFVFDHLASEIRSFGPDGAFIRTIGRKGSGPREIEEGNGLARGPDGTLWVNDHGRQNMIGLSEAGEEVGRHPMIVPGFSYIWNGSIDTTGVFHEQWSHSVGERQNDITATGPIEGEYRLFYKSFDPRTQAYDSVEVGIARSRAYRAAMENGQIVMSIPFSTTLLAAVDRGGTIWTAYSSAYTVAKLDTEGDTVLVIGLPDTPPPVTEADLESWREGFPESFGDLPAVRAGIEDMLPSVKPVLTALITDADGRLWVGRAVPEGEAALFDVFSPDGGLLGSVRTLSGIYPYLRPRIVGGRFYAVVREDLGVSYVMAAPLPQRLLQ